MAAKKLRAMDLADCVAKRPGLSKQQYIARVSKVIKTQKAQRVAKNTASRFRKICREVLRKKGAAARG